MTDMIRASGLVKRYGTVTALDGLDLAVPEGCVVGLLGPNGAGKTTAVRIFTTLLHADAGSAEVAGFDVRTEPQAVRERIGLFPSPSCRRPVCWWAGGCGRHLSRP